MLSILLNTKLNFYNLEIGVFNIWFACSGLVCVVGAGFVYVFSILLCVFDCDVNGFFEEVKSILRVGIDVIVFICYYFFKY